MKKRQPILAAVYIFMWVELISQEPVRQDIQ